MKKNQASELSAVELAKYQRETGFDATDFYTSAYGLEKDKARYAVKKEQYQQLWNVLNDGTAQVTIKSATGEASFILTLEDSGETLQKVLDPIFLKLNGELRSLQNWIVEAAAKVKQGVDECGLEASEEAWEIVKMLMLKKPKATLSERCPLLPALKVKKAPASA
ncbi:hypothetical protein [Hymenobacter sp. GOD-10R]|uniref:hypothetical protein n=1 Tax=Hymenobacter sp. GOD-10R TaxID=3093922 RepID=UPI002D79A530|nr:hypothetical protein [Hymenobacter sp. GOD-10R]WRQ27076.1 hypothetical protein SD425_18545 [Hymenobacter sp. GOD-10R]